MGRWQETVRGRVLSTALWLPWASAPGMQGCLHSLGCRPGNTRTQCSEEDDLLTRHRQDLKGQESTFRGFSDSNDQWGSQSKEHVGKTHGNRGAGLEDSQKYCGRRKVLDWGAEPEVLCWRPTCESWDTSVPLGLSLGSLKAEPEIKAGMKLVYLGIWSQGAGGRDKWKWDIHYKDVLWSQPPRDARELLGI